MSIARPVSLRTPTLRFTAAAAASLAALAGCPDDPEPPPPTTTTTPTVAIAGTHALTVGGTVTLVAVTSDGDDASYTWRSADGAIADVDAAGTVRGRAAGEVLITATGDDTGAAGSHAIVVQAAPFPTVSIAGPHRLRVGEQAELVAVTIDGADADHLWSIDNPTIATVDNGVVRALAVGDAVVIAEGIDSGAAGTFPLAVTGTSSVTIDGPFFLAIGDTAQLTASTINGADSGYTWASSDELLATVDELGVLRAVSAGEVTITATGVTTGLSGTLGVVLQQTIPHFDEWLTSGHADHTAEPFTHFEEDGAVSTSCARCHSEGGYRDFLGDDGSAPGVVDAPAALGTVVSCVVCHNDTAAALDAVTFPSGVTVENLGPEARCMVCHQGRSSSDTVDAEIAEAGVGDDEPSSDIGFINIHYFAAAATLNASRVRGAYQYAGETYDVRFRHIPDRDVCIECHDPHTLEVRVASCRTCHLAVSTVDDLKNIRMMSSLHTDYDGDGNLTEGIFFEMTGVRDVVFDTIQAYAREKAAPVCYDEHAHPYFFHDTDDDGACSASEASFGNRYTQFTPRLLRAAYNFQVASKDPGAFAHNAKYIIEALHDSAQDLNSALATPAALGLSRNDPGHFNGSGEPARHWDEDEEVSASCSRCHGASEGFRFYLQHGVGQQVLEQGNGLDCATCHDTFENAAVPSAAWQTVPVDSVLYPSGIEIDRPGDKGNICATCHQGRAAKVTVDTKIAAGGNLTFSNIHYLPAGAVRMGAQAQGGYEYDGNEYAGEYTDHLGGSSCIDCHRPEDSQHTFLVEDNLARCQLCHVGVTEPQQIRGPRHPDDTDGDGDSDEPLAAELDGVAAALLGEINVVGGACWGDRNPYFFRDTNGSGGLCDASEMASNNRAVFTPELLKAAFNYQLWHVDPGAWAHNYDYVAQLLIDSIDDLGGDVAGFVRPDVTP